MGLRNEIRRAVLIDVCLLETYNVTPGPQGSGEVGENSPYVPRRDRSQFIAVAASLLAVIFHRGICVLRGAGPNCVDKVSGEALSIIDIGVVCWARL